MGEGPVVALHSLDEIAAYHNDATDALRNFFSAERAYSAGRFFDTSSEDLTSMLNQRLDETDLRTCLVLLASIEAAFRVDYQRRCELKMKDSLSRSFRMKYKKDRLRVGFEDDLLRLWVEHHSGLKRVVGELRGAMKYRHWIAHGRYWEPRLGKRYDFDQLYLLGLAIQEQFPLIGRQ